MLVLAIRKGESCGLISGDIDFLRKGRANMQRMLTTSQKLSPDFGKLPSVLTGVFVTLIFLYLFFFFVRLILRNGSKSLQKVWKETRRKNWGEVRRGIRFFLFPFFFLKKISFKIKKKEKKEKKTQERGGERRKKERKREREWKIK